MYMLLEKIDCNTFFCVYKTKDYEFCLKLCRSYKERYSTKRQNFFVVESFEV